MNLKEKLLEQYYGGMLNEQRMTSLRKFIAMTGRDYSKMTPKQIDKIANTSAYKQFKKLRGMLRMQQKSEALKRQMQNEELINEYKRAPILGTAKRMAHPDSGQFHKKQFHAKKGQKQQILKRKIINLSGTKPVDIYRFAGHTHYRSVGPRGFIATQKGSTVLRGRRGSKSGMSKLVKTFYENVTEAKIDANVETPDLKTTIETKKFSPKTEKVFKKAKEINLNKDKDKIVINPELDNKDKLQD